MLNIFIKKAQYVVQEVHFSWKRNQREVEFSNI